jgi:hypothetical protein
MTTVFVVVFNILIAKYYDKNKIERRVLRYSTALYSIG